MLQMQRCLLTSSTVCHSLCENLTEGSAGSAAAAGYTGRNAPFEYASQTIVSARGTSFVGRMHGRPHCDGARQPGPPTDQPFNATVAPWELRVPEFIFYSILTS